MRSILIILLAGIFCGMTWPEGVSGAARQSEPLQLAQREIGRPTGGTDQQARQRAEVIRLLRQQIEQWRQQARRLRRDLTDENLQARPDVVELDNITWGNTAEVASLLLRQMRSAGDTWEKVYIGRGLLAMLDRAEADQLALQERLLVQAYRAAPDFVRSLPEPGVPFPAGPGDVAESPTAGPKDPVPPELSEEELIALRQAKLDAKGRNAKDQQIALINQALGLLQQDFTALMIKSRSPTVHQVVIDRLSRQLMNKDATFGQTIEALGQIELSRLDDRSLRGMRLKLDGLNRRFGGPQEYAVYGEVRTQERRQSDFGQTELDFAEVLGPLLVRLSQQIQAGPGAVPPEPVGGTPPPRDREPAVEDRPLDSSRARQMRQILMAIMLYYEDKDDWPNNLGDLDKVDAYSYSDRELAAFARTYRYEEPSGKPGGKNAGTAILFERAPSHAGGRLVGFGDGHIEFIKFRRD